MRAEPFTAINRSVRGGGVIGNKKEEWVIQIIGCLQAEQNVLSNLQVQFKKVHLGSMILKFLIIIKVPDLHRAKSLNTYLERAVTSLSIELKGLLQILVANVKCIFHLASSSEEQSIILVCAKFFRYHRGKLDFKK